MDIFRKSIRILMLACAVMHICCCQSKPIKALVISGQNNHNWQVSHKVLKQILDNSGLFVTDIALTALAGGDMTTFKPDFSQYDVVVLDYNGDRWPAETDSAFVKYVRKGGGVVIYHAADNAFAGWEEFNRIIALGGWEGRNEKSGPYCYLKDGELVLDNRPGHGGSHGQQREYPMHCRNDKHPITKDLPDNWMHARDEMYDSMRGPANIKDLLYSGTTDPATGGSGREEPLVFTVDYGKARIFHLMLGHCGPTAEDNPAMQCVGFQTLLLRGAEWAATGKVKQPVPADFPTDQSVSLRPDYKAPVE
ncbi:MAG: ThuA domain-containing protein [Bacteroidaceae bacterium]|nr:ThuA domain-containing protein [Bacteroidaceae bacterium]